MKQSTYICAGLSIIAIAVMGIAAGIYKVLQFFGVIG